MEEAEIVVLMCDAAIGVAEQDAKILGLVDERGRGMDQLSREELKEAEKTAREKVAFASWALRVHQRPHGSRDGLLIKDPQVKEKAYHRVPTGDRSERERNNGARWHR